MANQDAGEVFIEHRIIPVPVSISDDAQNFMRTCGPAQPVAFPAIDDHAGWRHHVAEADAAFTPWLAAQTANIDATVEQSEIAGVKVATATSRQIDETGRARILLFLHGGAMVYFGGSAIPHWALRETVWTGCPVVAVDYRMPPDHPYPAGIDDTVAVFRVLAERHGADRIAISGESGGAHFAAAAVLKIRDAGLPLPGALLLQTPELDLTETGDSFATNRDIDVVLHRGLAPINALYAGGHDLADPYLSPIFADFSQGFPPTLIQSGTRDLFLSNAVRMHRALRKHGVQAELHVGEAMPHGGFGGNTPEDRELYAEYRRFLERHIA